METACTEKCQAILECQCGDLLCSHLIPKHAYQNHSMGPISQALISVKKLREVSQRKLEIIKLADSIISEVGRITSEQLSRIESLKRRFINSHSEAEEELRSIDFKENLKDLLEFIKDLARMNSPQFPELKSKLDCLTKEVKERRVDECQLEEVQQELDKLDQEKAECLRKMGLIYKDMAKYQEAEKYQQKCLEIRKLLGNQSPQVAESYNDLGVVYSKMDKHRKAEEYLLKSLKIRETILDPQSPELAQSYSSLGLVYELMRKKSKAKEYHLKSFKIREAVLDSHHLDLASSYSDLGGIYEEEENYQQAEAYWLMCLKIREAVLNPQHNDLASIYNNLGVLHWDKKNYKEAENYFKKCLNIRKAVLDPEHPDLARVNQNLQKLCTSRSGFWSIFT